MKDTIFYKLLEDKGIKYNEEFKEIYVPRFYNDNLVITIAKKLGYIIQYDLF